MINAPRLRVLCFSFLLLLGACAGPVEQRPPAVRVPPGQDIAGLKIITEDGGHLAWSKRTNQIAFDLRIDQPTIFEFFQNQAMNKADIV